MLVTNKYLKNKGGKHMSSFSNIMDIAVSNVIQNLKGVNFTMKQVRDELMEELHRVITIVNDTLPKES